MTITKTVMAIIGLAVSIYGFAMILAFLFYDKMDLSGSQEYYGILAILCWMWAKQIEGSLK